MKRSSTSSGLRRPEPVLALLLIALLGSACVTRGTHREVLAQRDALAAQKTALEQRVQLLEASNESLSNERVQLIGEVDDLATQRSALAESIEELETRRSLLEGELEAASANLQAGDAAVSELRETYDSLVADLQAEVTQGRVQIEQLREGLRVNLAQEILFPLGSAQLDAEGRRVLSKVASRLAGLGHRVQVRGHTDALAITGQLARIYPSNWELAGARAASVVRLFESRGIDPSRLEAVSMGETDPVAPNDTPEGRALNRRIEVRLIPVPAVEVPVHSTAPAGGAATPAAIPSAQSEAPAP